MTETVTRVSSDRVREAGKIKAERWATGPHRRTTAITLGTMPTGGGVVGGLRAVSPESRRTAGVLLVVLPTVMYGGVSLLLLLINDPAYRANQLRQDLWRAGHAHAGVLLVLSLIALRYVDESYLSARLKRFVRSAIPSSAIFIPAAFFLSVLSPQASKPNGLMALAYVGVVLLAGGVLVLGIGLLRRGDDGGAGVVGATGAARAAKRSGSGRHTGP